MSFTITEQATPRLNRSELAVPGSSPKMFEKAAASNADVVFLDLEDAVAPDKKVAARENIVRALNEVDWGNKTLSVRINGLDTHYMYRDVVDIIEQGGDRLDLIMIPKVGTAADVKTRVRPFWLPAGANTAWACLYDATSDTAAGTSGFPTRPPKNPFPTSESSMALKTKFSS